MDVALKLKRVLLRFLDFDQFFARRLVRSLNPSDEQLYELEMGVFFFLHRQSLLSVGLPWHSVLVEQKDSEYGHARYFSKAPLPEVASFASKELPYSDWNGKQLNPGGHAIAKLFFGFIDPKDYGWGDRLAFMYVLEAFQSEFYMELAVVRGDYQLVRIALSESTHAGFLKSFILVEYAIAWRFKMLLVLIALWLRPSLVNKL
jgi:hypothetical protein